MIREKMQEAFNNQIREEIFSSYLYLSMAAYFESISLGGFASWMRCQSQEELVHAMKFFDHINERDGRVSLQALDQPQAAWDSPLAAFEAAYKHEQHISACIDNLVKVAAEENDNAAGILLQWFVNEQVEEEATAREICDMLRLVDGQGHGLMMIDRELRGRTFALPAAADAEEA